MARAAANTTKASIKAYYTAKRKELNEERKLREETFAKVGPERVIYLPTDGEKQKALEIQHTDYRTSIYIRTLQHLTDARRILRDAFGSWNDSISTPTVWEDECAVYYHGVNHKDVTIIAYVPHQELYDFNVLSSNCKIVDEEPSEYRAKVIKCEAQGVNE